MSYKLLQVLWPESELTGQRAEVMFTLFEPCSAKTGPKIFDLTIPKQSLGGNMDGPNITSFTKNAT